MAETSSIPIPERRAPLEVFFRPRNVAVIGATEDLAGVGRSLVSNLKQTSFGGDDLSRESETLHRAGFALLPERRQRFRKKSISR